MKKVLILHEGEFEPGNYSISSIEGKLRSYEPEYDDIFLIENGTINCVKARNNTLDEYTPEEFCRYITEG